MSLTEGRMAGIGVVLKDLDGKKHGRWVTRGSSGEREDDIIIGDFRAETSSPAPAQREKNASAGTPAGGGRHCRSPLT